MLFVYIFVLIIIDSVLWILFQIFWQNITIPYVFITHNNILMVVVLKAIILMIQEIEIQFWGLATNHTVVNDGPCILIYFLYVTIFWPWW